MGRRTSSTGATVTKSPPPLLIAPLSMSCWFFSPVQTEKFVQIISSSGLEYYQLAATAAGKVSAVTVSAGGNSSATNASKSYSSSSRWHMATAVFTTNLTAAFLDGRYKATSVPAVQPTVDSLGQFLLGKTSLNGSSSGTNTKIAYCALWNAALTDGEVARMFDLRLFPYSIRPDNLIGYYPLDDQSVVSALDKNPFRLRANDLSSGSNFLFADNPPMSPSPASLAQRKSWSFGADFSTYPSAYLETVQTKTQNVPGFNPINRGLVARYLGIKPRTQGQTFPDLLNTAPATLSGPTWHKDQK